MAEEFPEHKPEHITHHHPRKPRLSYSVYLLAIFALLVIVTIGVKGSNLDNYCPTKQVPCQVKLTEGEKSPYRNNVHAAYTGWHFAGYADMKACWVGYPSFCGICNDNIDARNLACQQKYPRHESKSSR